MRTEYYRAEDLAKVFRTQKIATMAELKDVLGSSADITIFRKLTELSSRTSYSHRGRFYTLADIPDYDAWGLWSYRSVWFSQRGTLLATAEALVQEADAGFFVAELEGVLNVEVKGALLRLVRQQKLARASVAGRYLYCAPDAATRNAQRSARRVLDAATPHGGRVPHIDVLPDELRASIKALKENGERMEDAPAVIREVHKRGTKADPLRGLFAANVNGRPAVVEYEPDTDLRDTEQIPLQEDGGIEAFLRREVLPYAADAWYQADSVKVGYEISFTRYFYKPKPMRTLAEIRADILGLEQETEGLLAEILGSGEQRETTA